MGERALSSRIFFLSPASVRGERARMILNPNAGFDLAVRLRNEGAPIGEVFSFISGLYFRGKMVYAQTFALPPRGAPASLVITASAGLVSPHTIITGDHLRRLSDVPIDAADPRYREPLERDARLLVEAAGPKCVFVLLGSVATLKYLQPLAGVFGERLVVPADFAGRGDMSRGGLLLRAARSGNELPYVPAGQATHHGSRPPKLSRLQPT